MQSSEQNVQECDATDDDSSNAAGLNIFLINGQTGTVRSSPPRHDLKIDQPWCQSVR